MSGIEKIVKFGAADGQYVARLRQCQKQFGRSDFDAMNGNTFINAAESNACVARR